MHPRFGRAEAHCIATTALVPATRRTASAGNYRPPAAVTPPAFCSAGLSLAIDCLSRCYPATNCHRAGPYLSRSVVNLDLPSRTCSLVDCPPSESRLHRPIFCPYLHPGIATFNAVTDLPLKYLVARSDSTFRLPPIITQVLEKVQHGKYVDLRTLTQSLFDPAESG